MMDKESPIAWGEPAPCDAPLEAALAMGRIAIARCAACGEAAGQLRACTGCGAGSDQRRLEPSAGTGTVKGAVLFARAYHPYFADKIPYQVLVVRLDEGCDVLCASEGVEPFRVGERVRLHARARGGRAIRVASRPGVRAPLPEVEA